MNKIDYIDLTIGEHYKREEIYSAARVETLKTTEEHYVYLGEGTSKDYNELKKLKLSNYLDGFYEEDFFIAKFLYKNKIIHKIFHRHKTC